MLFYYSAGDPRSRYDDGGSYQSGTCICPRRRKPQVLTLHIGNIYIQYLYCIALNCIVLYLYGIVYMVYVEYRYA